MLHNASISSGPRQSPGRLTSSGLPTRSGIQKRNTTSVRVDRDGDLEMGASGNTNRGGSGRGAVRRGSIRHRREATSDIQSTRSSTRLSRKGIDSSTVQRNILRSMGTNGTLPKGPRSSLKSVRGRDRGNELSERMDQVKVTGYKQSKAASNPDGGIRDLIGFLERKSKNPDGPAKEAVKITKSRVEGEALIISVRPEETSKITRLDQFTFAQAPLNIEVLESSPLASNADSETPNTIDILKAVLSRRYNVESKLLDLSQLSNDPELVNIGMFSTTSRESKFFPALMKICDSIFPTLRSKEEAVMSVSLARNSLSNITAVTTLSQTFPTLKNLDLSDNQIKNLTALEGWRWKFRKLDHVILTGNPIEQAVPAYKEDLLKWFPTLSTINQTRLRSPPQNTAPETVPLPVLGPSFRDEASIGENFVKHFFPTFDGDRTSLVNGYYDTQSTFSISVNTSAPRAPETIGQKSSSWDAYIKRSRNLVKVSQLPTRMSRLHKGTDSIRDAFLSLPTTCHPDLLSESQKWCIECHTIPGVPDLSGQLVSGVGGLMIMVHGEFSEVDVSTNQSTAARSFDRTFVLGPGGGVGGVRVVCDTLVLRSYGGHDAWQPDPSSFTGNTSAQLPALHQVALPGGFAVAGPGKTEEQVQKELLVLELSKGTGMTLEYSGMCLEQSAWNLEGAAMAFEQAKGNLPAEAFVSA